MKKVFGMKWLALLGLAMILFSGCDKIPEMVGELTAVIEDSSITISWVAVENAIDYEVYYSIKGDQDELIKFTGEIDPTGTEISGLLNDVDYEIVIYAINLSGKKSLAKIETFTPAKSIAPAPLKVSNIQIIAGNGQVTLTWDNPIENFSHVVILYGILAYSKQVAAEDIDPTGTVIPALLNNQKYIFKLVAYNDDVGSEEELLTATPVGVNPSVSISSEDELTNQSPIDFTITFSEKVIGLLPGEITVSGGAVSSFSTDNSIVYLLSVTPDSLDSTINVSCLKDICQNSSAELNLASNTSIVVYDATHVQQVSDLTANVDSSGVVTLSWNNPVDDFHHCLIQYFAEGTGIQNIEIAAGESNKIISGLNNRIEYTFEVLTVDPAGNQAALGQMLTLVPDLDALAIQERISNLPDPITESHRTLIEELKSDYDDLSEAQKNLVNNLDKLNQAILLLESATRGLVGRWLFDDESNMGKADFGDDLVITKFPKFVTGPSAEDKAVQVHVGEYFTANLDQAYITYSVAIDFKVSHRTWKALFQAQDTDADAELFINAEGVMGVGDLDYLTPVPLNEWHRMVMTIDELNHFKIYLNGENYLDIEKSVTRFGLINQNIIFFQDEDGEDGSIDVAKVEFYSKALTLQQVKSLGSLNPEIYEIPDDFSVAFYNVWDGWRHPDSSYGTEELNQTSKNEGASFLDSLNLDFLGLSELCYSAASDLPSFSNNWNHSSTHIIANADSYPIGCTANSDFKFISSSVWIKKEGNIEAHFENSVGRAGHGLIHIKNRGIHFFVTHLSSGYQENHDQTRIEQAQIILDQITPLLAKGESVLLMGDFNARSETDKKYYDDSGISSSENFSAKVYDAMKVFSNAGLVDLNDKMRAPGSYVGSYYAPSDIQKERIDYFWASSDIADMCTSCEIRTDAILKQVSDHFPIVGTFKK